jgi:hypothetical protein
MRRRLLWSCALALVVVQPARATTYAVGPTRAYATPSAVPWESLAAGDSVLIDARPTAYADKWVICRVGTQAQPIVVHGVPDPATGALPMITGVNAVTRTQLDFWNEERGVIKIGGANTPPDTQPAWIVVENLDIAGARSPNQFTGRGGVTTYSTNASSIYIEKGDHVTVRGCHLHDCGNGFFCASGTSELLVEKCRIEDNGNVGSIFEHNNYTESKGITFQFNHFGALKAGAGGNNLKDRSAGTVIRYNWIEGGNRQLDLVESNDPALTGDPRYHTTFVYGNMLIETGDDGNSQIAHYGGDGSPTSDYRKGTLYFYANTVVSKRTGNTTLIRLSTDDESCDLRDNVVDVSATGPHLGLLDQTGALSATRNWLNTGWVASHSGVSVNLVDNGQVTGSAPGFNDYLNGDYGLASGSPCVDQAVALAAACLPTNLPAFEYVEPDSSRPRSADPLQDLGAFERASVVGVGPLAPGASSIARLAVSPNPFTDLCDVRWVAGGAPGEAPPVGAVDVFDVGGRRIARVAATAPGAWRWQPSPGTPSGVYFARVAGGRTVTLYLR